MRGGRPCRRTIVPVHLVSRFQTKSGAAVDCVRYHNAFVTATSAGHGCCGCTNVVTISAMPLYHGHYTTRTIGATNGKGMVREWDQKRFATGDTCLCTRNSYPCLCFGTACDMCTVDEHARCKAKCRSSTSRTLRQPH